MKFRKKLAYANNMVKQVKMTENTTFYVDKTGKKEYNRKKFFKNGKGFIKMSAIIEIKNVSKEFKVLNRREGLKGSLKDLFSRDYKILKAVDNITMDVAQGEMVGYLGPN